MTTLHRHQLVRLTHAGWRAALDRPVDDEAKACLVHWAAHDLPLVVTRQLPGASAGDAIAVGLAAPARWSRRRLALPVQRAHVAGFDAFPPVDALLPLLPDVTRSAWQGLCVALAALQAPTFVYGSHGWQVLSGLACVHARSDIDLGCRVADADQAEAVAARLQAFSAAGVPRLDGELLFPDGRAVAWREWLAWRAGQGRSLLVKTLGGASLVTAWEACADPIAEVLPC